MLGGKGSVMDKAPNLTFAIGYKGHYYESQDRFVELIKAKNEHDALRIFCRKRKIDFSKLENLDEMSWEEGNWFMRFSFVHRAEPRTCWHCNGTGTILE